jgi:RNA polymerase sigma factor (sigma-70 family)
MEPVDINLIERCRHGDRDAFAGIVEQYQNLICSIAYSSTGNLGASEELAQETFVAAWRSIDQLRDPQRLRAWLCGIVRNLIRNAARQGRRDVLQSAATIDDRTIAPAGDSCPVDASIAHEEAQLIQRTLDAIPEAYREPLVLFYREQQSVARVADSLGLSESAVKQRLARGRKLLRSEIMTTLERGLRQSAPGRAFTLGVIAALPVMSGTAKAATVTITGVKGASAMHAAGWTGILGAILGPLAGIVAAWFGVKMSLKSVRSNRERAFIIKSTWWMCGLVGAFAIGVTALLLLGRPFVREYPATFAASVIGLAIAYTLSLLAMIFYVNKRQAQIRRESGTLNASPEEVAAQLPASMRRWQYPAVYQSSIRLFGLPLISIRFNGVVGDPRERKAAIGWIAIGDKAIGLLFACGPIAVGGIACGAIGLGAVSFAGLAIGVIPFGGAAIGWMATGGLASGMLAFGGCAVAWKAAMGGLAAAQEIALGGLAVAQHANDEVAKQFVATHFFFKMSDVLATHSWIWLALVLASFVPMLWARRKAERMSAAA